jgi:hypothetical protein
LLAHQTRFVLGFIVQEGANLVGSARSGTSNDLRSQGFMLVVTRGKFD